MMTFSEPAKAVVEKHIENDENGTQHSNGGLKLDNGSTGNGLVYKSNSVINENNIPQQASVVIKIGKDQPIDPSNTVNSGVSTSDVKIESQESQPLPEATKEQTKISENEQRKEKPKKKRKIRNKLALLLEDSSWYIESAGGSKVRESSLKIEKIKEQKLDELIHQNAEIDEDDKEPELTPEEIAEKERLRAIRSERTRQAITRKKQLKESRSKASKIGRERRKLIEQGLLEPTPPKKQKGKTLPFDIDNINNDSYYGGGEIAQLLKASQYFTNQGKEFNPIKREVKPVERLSQDLDYTSGLRRTPNKGKSLQHSKSKKDADKKPKRKYKKRKPKNSDTEINEGEEYDYDNYDEFYDAEDTLANNAEQQQLPPAEPESTPESEPIWFTNFIDNDIEIPVSWKFFQDFVYEEKNDSYIPTDIISGADIIRGSIKSYRMDHEVYKLQRVDLHFPFSDYKEQYLLGLPKDDIHYNPFDEIGKLMELMTIAFFPADEKIKVMNLEEPENCIVGRYIKMFENNDIEGLLKCINEFNQLIDSLRNNGKILQYTKSRNTFPREVVYELLNQCYLRRVLPESKKLSNYKAFSNEVYGELMPSFLSMVYSKCDLNHNCCFMDLGSGVGNCVIQAALEFGCESHGVEIVANASRLGDLQLLEFENRCRIFGIKPGFVNLFSKQSFVDNPPVKKIVDKCNVILVNNYLFDTKLNKMVVELFEDLAVGTKIISLKPIVPATHTIGWENCSSILNRLKTSKFIYEENSVSWTSTGGFYYITEVMNDIVEDNFVIFKSRGSRRRDEGLDERSRSDTPLNAFTNNV